MYHISQIASAIQTQLVTIKQDCIVEYLLTDSRKLVFAESTLFFAIQTNRNDGHKYIQELYERGVRNFIIEKEIDIHAYADGNFLLCANAIQALQQVAIFHRKQFNEAIDKQQLQIIGITGSNGKTIVKEWLNQLLQHTYSLVRSPRSYNSQIGVPLSVWQLQAKHNLAIFEAGISQPNEMNVLEEIIQPQIGIITNIGEAHNEGFTSKEEKINQKVQLLNRCSCIVIPDYLLPIKTQANTVISFGKTNLSTIQLISTSALPVGSILQVSINKQIHEFTIPFSDEASIQNILVCLAVLHALQFKVSIMQQMINQLQPVEMRLEVKEAIHNCTLINDGYSNDFSSLLISLQYLKQQRGNRASCVIISDVQESGMTISEQIQQLATCLLPFQLNEITVVSDVLFVYATELQQTLQPIKTSVYASTEALLASGHLQSLKDMHILIKGSRKYQFEKIAQALTKKMHQTVLQINLNALLHNLHFYISLCKQHTKIMAMVKAFGYGSGSVEVAKLLQNNGVHYVAVAYADEGIELRQAGIHMPIMVLNIEPSTFDALISYNLEPEIFSFDILHQFTTYLKAQGIMHFPVHIKVNTGMNRLGFDINEAEVLCHELLQKNCMHVQSVFTHLTSSEDEQEDAFTQSQITKFNSFCTTLSNQLQYTFLQHFANSAAIIRYQHYKQDMVRLGIGLYGSDSSGLFQQQLKAVATLKTTIAQIRKIETGETVGYNRKGKITKPSVIATIRIGYADGLRRDLSNGKGYVYLHGKKAAIIGNVCMDMTMIDVTEIKEAKVGDEVEIFGEHISVNEVAKQCNTIPYEILTSIHQRVKRVYVEE